VSKINNQYLLLVLLESNL